MFMYVYEYGFFYNYTIDFRLIFPTSHVDIIERLSEDAIFCEYIKMKRVKALFIFLNR